MTQSALLWINKYRLGLYLLLLTSTVHCLYDHAYYSTRQSHHHFQSLYREYHDICTIPENNLVHAKFEPTLPWSLESGAVHKLFDIDFTHGTLQATNKPICQSANEVLASIRLPLDEQTCLMRWFTPEDLCALFYDFGMVWFEGDSLSRHITNTLYMMMKGDLRYGAMPPNTTEYAFNHCACDAQYSESFECRYDGIPTPFHVTDFRRFGMCSTTTSPSSHLNFYWVDNLFLEDRFFDRMTCDNSTKPMFVYFQGGIHYQLEPQRAKYELVMNVIERINHWLPECKDRIVFLFSGAVVSHPQVEEGHPYQYRDHVRDYHQQMESILHEIDPKIMVMDVYNLTRDAVNRTVDGLHSLTDTNLIKTTVILNVMYHVMRNHTQSQGGMSHEAKQVIHINDGDVLRCPGKGLYYIQHHERHHIPNWETFVAMNMKAHRVRTVTEAELLMIPEGSPIDELSVSTRHRH